MFFLLNRYFLRFFLVPFFCCFFSFLVLFLLSSVNNNLGDFSSHVDNELIISYFLYLLPQSFQNFLPISVLLGAIYCITTLNYNNEIVACRAGGISLFQMSFPLLVLSFFLSVVLWANNEYLIPYAGQKIQLAKEQMAGEVSFGQRQFVFFEKEHQRQWVYNLGDNYLSDVYLHQLKSNNQLKWDLFAKKAVFDNSTGEWTFINGSIASYQRGSVLNSKKFKEYKLALPEKYISLLRQKNEDVVTSIFKTRQLLDVSYNEEKKRRLQTTYYSLIVSPFVCVIAMLFGIGLSVSNNRHLKSTVIALSIPLMILYSICFELSLNLGYMGILSSIMSAITVPIIFFIFGVIIFYKRN